MAKVSIYIPTPFRAQAGGSAQVEVEAATVLGSLQALVERHPGLRERVFGPDGHVLEHLNVYVNEEEMRALQGEETPLKDGDEVAIVPAMAGGAATGGAVSGTAPLLTDEQLERYSRHILLEEVGVEGQRRLLDRSVAVIGAGGLGSPVALYLAAAGVGTIGIVDGDVVDRSNLQRQILHGNVDVGRAKSSSAAERLRALNPDVRVIEHRTILSSENAFDILDLYDVVVNGSDNFPTRYLVNDACVMLEKPLVDASILKWEGMLSVFLPGEGCYRCLYPSPPPPGSVPSCAEGGILGAVAGVMGSLQAVEALKVLLTPGTRRNGAAASEARGAADGGTGGGAASAIEPLAGRSLLYDALSGRFRQLKWRRNPACPVCGDEPVITHLIDYEQFCGVPMPRAQVDDVATGAAPAASVNGIRASEPPAQAVVIPAADAFPPAEGSLVTAAEAGAHLDDPDVVWFDVRLPHEYERGHVPGSRLLPLDDLGERMAEIPRDKVAVFVCDTGQKSGLAVEILRASGFPRAYNLKDGLVAWTNRRLPLESGSEAVR